MVSKKVTINNEQGFHMRPAKLFVGAITKFPCDVTIIFSGKEINAKSIMNIMASCIKKGAEIEIKCDGEGEQDALNEAVKLVEANFLE